MLNIVTCITFWRHIPAERFAFKNGQTDQQTSTCALNKPPALTFWLVGWLVSPQTAKHHEEVLSEYYTSTSVIEQTVCNGKLFTFSGTPLVIHFASLRIWNYTKLTTISAVMQSLLTFHVTHDSVKDRDRNLAWSMKTILKGGTRTGLLTIFQTYCLLLCTGDWLWYSITTSTNTLFRTHQYYRQYFKSECNDAQILNRCKFTFYGTCPEYLFRKLVRST
jgi:hypothetical protein